MRRCRSTSRELICWRTWLFMLRGWMYRCGYFDYSTPEWYFRVISSSLRQQTNILINNTWWLLKKWGEEGEIQTNIFLHQVQGLKYANQKLSIVENIPSLRFPSHPALFLLAISLYFTREARFVLQMDLFHATEARSAQNHSFNCQDGRYQS